MYSLEDLNSAAPRFTLQLRAWGSNVQAANEVVFWQKPGGVALLEGRNTC